MSTGSTSTGGGLTILYRKVLQTGKQCGGAQIRLRVLKTVKSIAAGIAAYNHAPGAVDYRNGPVAAEVHLISPQLLRCSAGCTYGHNVIACTEKHIAFRVRCRRGIDDCAVQAGIMLPKLGSGLGIDTEDTTIVEAVVKLGHSLGLVVVAEGVETPLQLARLREIGCDHGQGYVFGRPRPAELVESEYALV